MTGDEPGVFQLANGAIYGMDGNAQRFRDLDSSRLPPGNDPKDCQFVIDDQRDHFITMAASSRSTAFRVASGTTWA
jgi:hypothetical protein